MKLTILTTTLALVVGVSSLVAQKAPPKGSAQAQPAASAPKGPAPKSKEELAALQALINARSSPDATIKASEDLLTRFADTDFKHMALFSEASAYESKGAADKAQVYAERTL